MELAWNVAFQQSGQLAGKISAGIHSNSYKITERAKFLQKIYSVMEKYAQKHINFISFTQQILTIINYF